MAPVRVIRGIPAEEGKDDLWPTSRKGGTKMTVTIARVAKRTPFSPLDAGTELYLDLLKKTLMGSIYEEGQWTIFGHMRNKILRRIAKLLRKRSMVLLSTRDRDPESRARGEVWPIIGYTMIGA